MLIGNKKYKKRNKKIYNILKLILIFSHQWQEKDSFKESGKFI